MLRNSFFALLFGLSVSANDEFRIVYDDQGVSSFAHEPLMRDSFFITFDAVAWRCAGMCQSCLSPRRETNGVAVLILINGDGDGEVGHRNGFSTNSNSRQVLRWNEGKQWLAIAPDLTFVRDSGGLVRLSDMCGSTEMLGSSKGLNHQPNGVTPKLLNMICKRRIQVN